MQKILILIAKTMQLDRNVIYNTKETKAVMVVKAYYRTIIFEAYDTWQKWLESPKPMGRNTTD